MQLLGKRSLPQRIGVNPRPNLVKLLGGRSRNASELNSPSLLLLEDGLGLGRYQNFCLHVNLKLVDSVGLGEELGWGDAQSGAQVFFVGGGVI